MKRLYPAILACGLLSTSAQAQSDPVADSRTVVALVAASAVREYRAADTGVTCVQPALSNAALDEYRRHRQMELADPSRRAEYQRRGEPGFEWRVSTGLATGSQPPLLDEEARRPLDEAAGAIIRAEPGPHLISRLDSAWLDGVPFCGAGLARSNLSLSAPVFSGDLAFVETGYGCGGLCGNGYLYALRRSGVGRWAIVAVAWTWVS